MHWLTMQKHSIKKMQTNMDTKQEVFKLESEIVNLLKDTYDPEIPVNIYDLGLIYDIDIDEQKNVKVTMTLTAPNCPVADILPNEIKEKIETIPEILSVEINLVFDPPWNQSMMSEEALFELGML